MKACIQQRRMVDILTLEWVVKFSIIKFLIYFAVCSGMAYENWRRYISQYYANQKHLQP